MKKLIEIQQENLIMCDNPECDFIVENKTKDPFIDASEYINVACPKCGQNLLTEEDYHKHQTFLNIVKWLNKYFSWLTIFFKNERKTMFFHGSTGIVADEPKKIQK